MHDDCEKLIDDIKSFYVEILACVGTKENESEFFRIDFRLRQGCVMSI